MPCLSELRFITAKRTSHGRSADDTAAVAIKSPIKSEILKKPYTPPVAYSAISNYNEHAVIGGLRVDTGVSLKDKYDANI
jgi:hypothetical protein